jgi:hypothetical protein
MESKGLLDSEREEKMITCYCQRFYRIDNEGQHWIAIHPDLESRVSQAKGAEAKQIVRSMIEELEANPDTLRWIRTSHYTARTLELTRQFYYSVTGDNVEGDDEPCEYSDEEEAE